MMAVYIYSVKSVRSGFIHPVLVQKRILEMPPFDVHVVLYLPSPIDLEDKDLNNSNKITDYSGSLADAEFNKLLMFLMTIMKCSDDYCEEVDHVAHLTFIKKPIQFHRTEMKKAGYGADKFGVQFIEALHDKIQRTIAVTKRKNPRKPYTGGVFLTLRSLP
ncbi:hypothetical protein ScPMuIL_008716 [Solemya velum]